MNYSPEQVINGIINYADKEIMVKLPTTGKWVFGTVVNLTYKKVDDVIANIMSNAIVNMLGIVDDNGNIDVDNLIVAMKSAADKYGSISIDMPLVGKLTFSSTDIDALKQYIV